MHDHFDLDRAAQTQRVVAAMHDPSVRMIGHLSARMIGGRPPIELDLDAVFAAADETGTALEVNGGLPRLDISVDALRRARTSAVTFVLTSDAHHESELDRVDHAALQRRARVGDPGAGRERRRPRATARVGAEGEDRESLARGFVKGAGRDRGNPFRTARSGTV